MKAAGSGSAFSRLHRWVIQWVRYGRRCFPELESALYRLSKKAWAIAACAIVESCTAFKKEPMAPVMQYLL
jgi:hypothetical protein